MRYSYKLYGAILGDLSGQPHEFPAKGGPRENIVLHNPDGKCTDDTLMTLASANYLLGNHKTIEEAFKDMGQKYPGDHYGKGFKAWLLTPLGTIGDSYGNGCLMRISPFMYMEEDKRIPLIMDSILCSHRHYLCIESVMKLYLFYKNGINHPEPIIPFKKFEVIADKTVDFCLNLSSWRLGTQQTIVKAIEQGGDTDTNASICGEISNYFERDIKQEDVEYVESKLDPYLLNILKQFNEKF
jgi:ADP-ribosylglycohydrolase